MCGQGSWWYNERCRSSYSSELASFPGPHARFHFSTAVGLVYFLTCVTHRVEGWIFAWARTVAVLRQWRKAVNLYFLQLLFGAHLCHRPSAETMTQTTVFWAVPAHAQLSKSDHMRKYTRLSSNAQRVWGRGYFRAVLYWPSAEAYHSLIPRLHCSYLKLFVYDLLNKTTYSHVHEILLSVLETQESTSKQPCSYVFM